MTIFYCSPLRIRKQQRLVQLVPQEDVVARPQGEEVPPKEQVQVEGRERQMRTMMRTVHLQLKSEDVVEKLQVCMNHCAK